MWVYDDGGREASGFYGQTGDCAARAVAIATGLPYRNVYMNINAWARRERPRGNKERSDARTGVWVATMHRYMDFLGWRWTATMHIGSGCQVHLRADELPGGTLIARVSRHYTTVIDGVIHDTHDPSRDGTRCVYGYWQPNI